jgi:hypothetical protein
MTLPQHPVFRHPQSVFPLVWEVRWSCPCALTEHHAMKAYWESEGTAPRILDLATRWRWVVSFVPQPLYPQGKSPWYPLDRRLGGPQSRSGRGGDEKNSQTLPGLEPPIIQSVAQRCTTELSRLLTPLVLKLSIRKFWKGTEFLVTEYCQAMKLWSLINFSWAELSSFATDN